MMDHPPTLPIESPSQRSTSSPSVSHRSSLAEGLRQSPRVRHPSLGQASVQELINHPPTPKTTDPRFVGRDWMSILVGELVLKIDVRWAELDTPIEPATKLLLETGPPNVILVRENKNVNTACDTFDFNDLNAYLQVVVGLAKPDEDQVDAYNQLAAKTKKQLPVPLREVTTLAKKSALVTLSENDNISKAIEIFGSGVHRILVRKANSTDVVGILSQLKLVQFLWDNGSQFPAIDRLYPVNLRDLGIGTPQIISINGDRSLADALQLMSNEGITSIAVVDNAMNVIGNISTVDVRLLTSSASLPLLQLSCIHFISIILSERGVENGKDSFPVFHVNPYSTLAHTVAKLVATRSHRMWIVESASPSPSAPATPLATPALSHSPLVPSQGSHPTSPSQPGVFTVSAVSAAAVPGARISGRLTGVISLTDILNLFARQSGLHPASTNDQRDRRRRSSSSSVRPSIDDSTRGSSFDIRR
ncbi:hypothetical protein BJ878DRAFT_479745 [Calycina marina]|uniref:Protein SDS23 n=1 Tax=Calycina marina TaxID=1763456 RepID=A0A9P8CF80_9HELO|nr:hypothetical protein BJ878DRAFT_479745 [Calycina marina]